MAGNKFQATMNKKKTITIIERQYTTVDGSTWYQVRCLNSKTQVMVSLSEVTFLCPDPANIPLSPRDVDQKSGTHYLK